MIRPHALAEGARVALIAPAGPVAPEAVERAVVRVREFGWEPALGAHAGGRHGFLAGTDDERTTDLEWALYSEEIDAVWCLRGGYGTMRILERIDWTKAARHARPVIGFSDNTALHLALQREGVVSFHGPHPGVEDFPSFAAEGLRKMLSGTMASSLPFPEPEGRASMVAPGVAEGQLVGGNLALLCATLGTPYQLQCDDALLFLEDVGEPVYRIDRLLTQLRLSGVMEGVAGIVLGAFSDCTDADSPHLPPIEEVLRERLGGLGIPVARDFPFGHVPLNWTLPLGVRARLDADAGTLELLEPPVRLHRDNDPV